MRRDSSPPGVQCAGALEKRSLGAVNASLVLLVLGPLVKQTHPLEQESHARRLIDTAAFRFDNAVLYLVGHSQTVTAADGVGFENQIHWIGEALTVQHHRRAFLERDRYRLGLDYHVVA